MLWCHNANGMEAPVAAALGRLDGLNLFDPYWMDPEYDALVPAAQLRAAAARLDRLGLVRLLQQPRLRRRAAATFSYEAWLGGLRAGRTFVTDGPALRLTVAGHAPGNDVLGLSERDRVRAG